jgi:hypothetical protein
MSCRFKLEHPINIVWTSVSYPSFHSNGCGPQIVRVGMGDAFVVFTNELRVAESNTTLLKRCLRHEGRKSLRVIEQADRL